jgi:flagellar assembly protein FliH
LQKVKRIFQCAESVRSNEQKLITDHCSLITSEEFVQQAETATSKNASGRIEVFEYPAGPDAPFLPEWNGWENAEDAAPRTPAAPVRDAASGAIETRLRAEFEARLAEEKRHAIEAGRQEGHKAEREAQSGSQAATQRERVQQAAGLVESFTQERDHYLQKIEHEVVKLALAVAARILRREAQMDPLLLTGAVRVALGQLSQSTQVRLRVPPAELNLWSEAIALVPNLALKPAVIAGEGMRLGDCVIETELGSVDLGIRAQLGEIERGFFDRAGGSKAVSSSADTQSSNADLPGADTGAEQESRA